MTPLEALNKAIDALDEGVGGFADRLGVRQSAVSNWRSRLQSGEQSAVPAEHCPTIERMTGVPCEALNPQVDWSFLRGTAARAA